MRRYGINNKTFRLKNNEINPKSDIKINGFNLQLDNVSSMVGYFNLLELPKKLSKQKKKSAFYDQRYDWFKKVNIFNKNENSETNNFLYLLIIDNSNRFIKFLNKHKIQGLLSFI